MKNITILYNTTDYVFKFRINLIKKIMASGYQVVVLSPRDKYVADLEKLGVKHYHIPMSQYGMNPFSSIYTTFCIFKAFRKFNPKYSLHYTIKPNIFGGIAARFTKTQVINNIAGAGKAFSNESSFFSRFIQRLYKFGLKKSKKVLFQNLDDKMYFERKGLVRPECSERIPGSGVDLKNFKSGSNISPDNKFLFIGRLLKEKGIKEYLSAAKELRDYNATFSIVGEHNESSDYIDMTCLEDYLRLDNIKYYGAVESKNMVDLIDSHDCIVLPSYYREGVPRSLLESASLSKPLITTNNVGCRDTVDNGVNGFLCEVRSTKSLTNSMKTYIDLDLDQKQKMGDAGRKKVEKEFDEKIVLDTYLRIINEECSSLIFGQVTEQ